MSELTVNKAKALKELGMRYLVMTSDGAAIASDNKIELTNHGYWRLQDNSDVLFPGILDGYYDGDYVDSLVDLNNDFAA